MYVEGRRTRSNFSEIGGATKPRRVETGVRLQYVLSIGQKSQNQHEGLLVIDRTYGERLSNLSSQTLTQ